MKLTLQTDYSLRVILYIGANEGARSTIHQIAIAYDISENHLTKIVHNLTTLGYLDSARGRHGGLKLPASLSSVRLGDFISKLEPDFLQSPWFEEPVVKVSGLRQALIDAQEAFVQSLNRYDVGQLLAPKSKLRKTLNLSLEPGTVNLNQ